MKINPNIVNRALKKAGQEELTEDDILNNSNVWRIIKDYYLSTILETLSNTAWTSQMKRAYLIKDEDSENLTNYSFKYLLPIDCAKPEKLKNGEDYDVEGNYLYTDIDNAVLLYVSNGKTDKVFYVVAFDQPTEDNFLEKDYFIFDEENNTYTKATMYDSDVLYYVEKEEDYPGYTDLDFDPLLSEYIETKLASKIVLKITGDTQLYQLLYSEAQLMENRAVKASMAHSHNKETGDVWWADELGLR